MAAAAPSSSSSSSLDRLPQEVIANILLRLPTKSLLDLRRVCKSWRSIMLSLSFSTEHLRRSEPHQNLLFLHLPRVLHRLPFLPRQADFYFVQRFNSLSSSSALRPKFAIPFDRHASSFEVIGSVDGLICVSQLHKGSVQSMYLWNPTMGKLRNLRTWDVVERVEGESGNRIHGFGRDHRSHVYRVVRITDGRTGKGKKESSMEAVQVEVCTVGRDSWKMLEPHGVSCFPGSI